MADGAAAQRPPYPGERFGLPAVGAGALAGAGRRLGALTADLIGSWLVAALFVRSPVTGAWSTLVFVIEYTGLIALTGQSAGMRLFGLRVARCDGGALALGAVLARTALLCLVIPAVVWDRDGRCLHDRLTGAAVIRV